MAFVGTFFTAVGRLAVRFRWAIVLAWIIGVVAAMALLPSLGSVTQGDNTSFLPASAPSQRAAQLAAPLQAAALTAVTVVVARSGGMLTSADQAGIGRLAVALGHVSQVVSARDAGQSADGQAEQLTVLAALAQSGGLATTQQAHLVAGLRSVIRSNARPAGLEAHLAGAVATRVDNNTISAKTGGQVQWFSIIFVIALLVAVFRSALAPLIAVLPAVVVVLVAERLTAEAAVHGLSVSQIASLLLIVLVLGAGTDYALFLMFRVREEMRAGLACHEAIVTSVGRVGETITFSAGILIAALLSLATASFSLYSGLAAPLAIAIALMLAAGLTLLPGAARDRGPGRVLAILRQAGYRAGRLVGPGVRADRVPSRRDPGRRPPRLRRARGGLGRVPGRRVRRGGDRAARQRLRAGRRIGDRALPADRGQPHRSRPAAAAAGLGRRGPGGRRRAATGRRPAVHRGVGPV